MTRTTDAMFAGQAKMRKAAVIFLLVLVSLLVVGTFQIDILKTVYYQIDLALPGIHSLQETLFRLVPFEPQRVKKVSLFRECS